MSSGPRYKRKVDANQPEILTQAAGVPGLNIRNESRHPGLGYDAVGRYQDGPAHMLEIKRGPKDGLTDSEKAARVFFGAYWHRVETFEDILTVFGIETEQAPF